MKQPSEFELIELIVAELGRSPPADPTQKMVVGPGDDASAVRPEPDELWVSSIDTLVADVHFPARAGAELIGYRALGVSVSDLAAMGASPSHALVSVTLPSADAAWLRALARGIAAAATDMGILVAGGNLARGPLNIAVSVHGSAPEALLLRRSGARPGDLVYVTGRLGAAALALRVEDLGERRDLAGLEAGSGADAYFRPRPQLDTGIALRGRATSAIDISDGLLADAGHLAAASGVAIEIDPAAVPLADGASIEDAFAGDDYELCFTATAPVAGIAAVAVGRVLTGSGARVPGGSGMAGYRHF